MSIQFTKSAIVLLVLALGMVFPKLIQAQSGLTPGNVLVAEFNSGNLHEFTTSGTLVQTFNIPNPNSNFTDLRDIVVGQSGDVFAFSGTFEPTLATLTPSTGQITRDQFDGWSTVNNVSFGGIGALGRHVYVTDTSTAGAGSPIGIVRFDTLGGDTVRFGDSGYIDLTIGGDGLLYALRGGTTVDVYDPSDNQLLDSLNLDGTSDVRGIAVDSSRNIYAASWDELVSSHDSSGGLIDSFAFTDSGLFDNDLTDIDINDNGDLLVSSRFGGVLLGDTSLSGFTSFNSGSGVLHATFVTPQTVPEPSTLVVLLISGSLLLSRRNRAS